MKTLRRENRIMYFERSDDAAVAVDLYFHAGGTAEIEIRSAARKHFASCMAHRLDRLPVDSRNHNGIKMLMPLIRLAVDGHPNTTFTCEADDRRLRVYTKVLSSIGAVVVSSGTGYLTFRRQ